MSNHKRSLTPDEQATYDAAMEQFAMAAKVMNFNGDMRPLQRALDMLHSIPRFKLTRWQRFKIAVKVWVTTFYDFHLRPSAVKVKLLRAYLKVAGKL